MSEKSKRPAPRNLEVFVVVSAAMMLFFVSLFGLADYVDHLALMRQKAQLQNAFDHTIRETAARIAPIASWDDGVRHIDNTFDPVWAESNIGQYFTTTDDLVLSFILDKQDRPIYGMVDGKHVPLGSYARLAPDLAPLIAKVRAGEIKRGILKPPFRTVGYVSDPIQAGAIVRTPYGLFVIIISLVQPDTGKALPAGRRSPILVTGQKIDSAFLTTLGDRLLISSLKSVPANTSSAVTLDIKDIKGRAVGRVTWVSYSPGEYLISFAFLPILFGILLPLVLYFRSRKTALRLSAASLDLESARDAAENAQRQAEENLAAAVEASRAKSEFLANMSHELRTPLNAILGFSEMLESDTFAKRRAEYAALIHKSGAYLLGLVNDLLDLSRIEANKVELHEEVIDIGDLLHGCVDVLEPQAMEGHVMLGCCVENGLPKVLADHRALRQILLNLLSNAIKFTDAGKKVEVFAQSAPDGGLTLGVKDEGSGIPEEEQALMFERFGQGRHDIARALKGTGLGLPIVRGLTEAHGGRVTLESKVGVGTCVTIWLPPKRLQPNEVEVMLEQRTTRAV